MAYRQPTPILNSGDGVDIMDGPLMMGNGRSLQQDPAAYSGRMQLYAKREASGFLDAFIMDEVGRVVQLTNAGVPAVIAGCVAGQIGFGNATATGLGFASSLIWDNANLRLTVGKAWVYTPGTSNVFVGEGTGNATLTAYECTAFGYQALPAVTSAIYNTAVGSRSLFSVTTGGNNTAVGQQAAQAIVDGIDNCAFGCQALFSNISSLDLCAFGLRALMFCTAPSNDAFGTHAQYTCTTGTENVAVGSHASKLNSTGSHNSALGYRALYNNTASDNCAFGHTSLFSNTSGTGNAAFGWQALTSNLTGNGNSAFGYGALITNQTGGSNIAIGYLAMTLATGSSSCVGIGLRVLGSLTTGSNNIAIGENAGFSTTTASGNVFIGFNSGYFETGANKLYIANSNTTTPLIYGDFGTSTLICNGTYGVNTANPRRRLDVLDTSNPQARFTYTDNSVYTDFKTNSNGYLVISPTGGRVGVGVIPAQNLHVLDAAGAILRLDDGAGRLVELRTGGSSNSPSVGTLYNAGIGFFTNSINAFMVDANQTLVPSVTLATNMTTGFINIPAAAGAPTGVPATTTGVPLYYDKTNNFLYVYNGGWKKSTVYA